MTDATVQHTCFDRVIPDALAPVRSHLKHLSRVHFDAISSKFDVASDQLPDLDADYPVWTAYIALVNHSKWPNGYVLTCCFLDGDEA